MVELNLLDMVKVILADNQLRGPQKMVLVDMVFHLDYMGESRLDYASLARECGITDRSAKKIVSELIDLGWIQKIPHGFIIVASKFGEKISGSSEQSKEKGATKYRDRAKSDKRRVELSEGDVKALVTLLTEKDHFMTVLHEHTGNNDLLPAIDQFSDLRYRLEEFLNTRFINVAKEQKHRAQLTGQ